MAMKRYRPEEIITKLREAEVLLAQGMKVPEVAKAIGIHEITYYRWRKEFGGLKVSQAVVVPGVQFHHSGRTIEQ